MSFDGVYGNILFFLAVIDPNRDSESVVFNCDQKMALRAVYVVIF